MAYSMPCRDLNSLNPLAKQACELFIQECKKQGLTIGVCETLRTAEYQNSLYQKGRTKPGSIVTNCDGYKVKSEHQSGMAFDFFQNIKGKEWDKSFYDKACPIAKKMGLDCGYYWKGFVDNPHITVPKDWKNSNSLNWKQESIKRVCSKYSLEQDKWIPKWNEQITVGDFFAIIEKILK